LSKLPNVAVAKQYRYKLEFAESAWFSFLLSLFWVLWFYNVDFCKYMQLATLYMNKLTLARIHGWRKVAAGDSRM